jgi:fermentation-respiration switch protein FrsA (DUF1100 family)
MTTTIVLLLSAYVMFGALLFLLQRQIMYPVPATAVEPKPASAVLLKIPGKSNTVYALHIPAPPSAPTAVYFHGNAEQLADQTELGEAFREAGIGFLAVEYPGYGLARQESTTEDAVYGVAEIALRYLQTTFGVERRHLVIQGRSLGTGVAVEMARRGFGSRIVLISPFTSMVDMAKRTAPLYPVGLLLKDRYDNQSKAREIGIPVLVIHGKDDEIIPFSMGQKLSRAFPRAQLYAVERARHNDLFFVGGAALFKRIADFVRLTSDPSISY